MTTKIVMNVLEPITSVEGFDEKFVVVFWELLWLRGGFEEDWTLIDWVGKALGFLDLGQGGFGSVVRAAKKIVRRIFGWLFLHAIFCDLVHIWFKYELIVSTGSLEQLGEDIIFNFEMFLTGKCMPLINGEMVIIKKFKLGMELLLIIKQNTQDMLLLGDEFLRFEFGDLGPYLLLKLAGKCLLEGDVLGQEWWTETDAWLVERGVVLFDWVEEHY